MSQQQCALSPNHFSAATAASCSTASIGPRATDAAANMSSGVRTESSGAAAVAVAAACNKGLAAGNSRRRARRGKKRRSHEQQQQQHHQQSQQLPLNMQKDRHSGLLKKRCVQIRPWDVPQAPANFTQFIIDDHFESCPGLYQSFETPPVSSQRRDSSSDSEAPHSSVNYDSDDVADHPCDYSQMMAFHEKDFEEVYSDARAAEVIDLPHDQLVNMYCEMEKRENQLSTTLSIYSPQHLLEHLQRRLLDLQEENRVLKARNRALRYTHSEDSQGSVDSESDSSSSSTSSSSSSSNSDNDDDGAAEAWRDQDEEAQAVPDCAAVNDNAMFQMVAEGSNHDRLQARHNLNEGSSSTLDFRSFQDALFNSHSRDGNDLSQRQLHGHNSSLNQDQEVQVTSSCKTPVETPPYGEIEAMG